MLVDLARNDVNRVCDPLGTRVDKLMVVQKVCYPSSERLDYEINSIHMLTSPVFTCPALGFRGVRGAATWQDAIRCLSLHLSCRYVTQINGAGRAHCEIGTVSGAPKVRAMQLIAELEREKRGVYAGAVGYFGYGSVDGEKEIEGAMDVSWNNCFESYVWLIYFRRASRYGPCLSRTVSHIYKQG
jgi:anthranilate synthase component 1